MGELLRGRGITSLLGCSAEMAPLDATLTFNFKVVTFQEA
jgi:hypothetical protein